METNIDNIRMSRAKGPALLMEKIDHLLTRTFSGRGKGTMVADVLLTARERLAKDVANIRTLFGRKYNKGLMKMLEYANTLADYMK